jgi:tetratricopeptide (TPR) repeat protein
VEQYLWNLLRAQPEDNTLRLRLAEQRMALQKFHSALYLLRPLLDGTDVEWQRKAARLAVESLAQQFFAALPASMERAEIGRTMRGHLRWLLQHEDNPVLLERLATKALAMDEPALAAHIYQRVATMGERWPEWYADAGRIALAAGDHMASAHFYELALARADDAPQRQQFLLAAVKALQSGDRLDEAVALAAQADGDLGADPELRGQLVRMVAQSRESAWRTVLLSRLRASIVSSLQTESATPAIESLLSQVRMLGDDRLMLQVLTRAAAADPDRDPVWYANAARLALGQSEYRLSARFYWDARRTATTREQQRGYFIEGLRALQAGNLLAEALQDADRELGDLAEDRETIYVLAQLALAANRLDMAEGYARRLLRADTP